MSKVVSGYKEQARERILDSASKLFYQAGYHSTGMDDIAKSIGVTKGTLYLYFKNKEDLLIMACQRNTTLLEESLKNAIKNDFLDSFDRFFEEEMKMPDHIRFHWIFSLMEVETNTRIKKILVESYKKYVDMIAAVLEELKGKHAISGTVDSVLVAKMLIAFHNGILASMLQGLGHDEAVSMFKSGIRLLLSV